MEVNMNWNALLNAMLIAGVENSNQKDSKRTAAILKVFDKHGIGVMDAMVMLGELSDAIRNTENTEK